MFTYTAKIKATEDQSGQIVSVRIPFIELGKTFESEKLTLKKVFGELNVLYYTLEI